MCSRYFIQHDVLLVNFLALHPATAPADRLFTTCMVLSKLRAELRIGTTERPHIPAIRSYTGDIGHVT